MTNQIITDISYYIFVADKPQKVDAIFLPGGSARTIMQHITEKVGAVDEKAFLDEWKVFYKKHTAGSSVFKTECEIFIAQIQMFYDRFGVNRNAERRSI